MPSTLFGLKVDAQNKASLSPLRLKRETCCHDARALCVWLLGRGYVVAKIQSIYLYI